LDCSNGWRQVRSRVVEHGLDLRLGAELGEPPFHLGTEVRAA
jgi:hypothetical protein